jgi:hypothetical protein
MDYKGFKRSNDIEDRRKEKTKPGKVLQYRPSSVAEMPPPSSSLSRDAGSGELDRQLWSGGPTKMKENQNQEQDKGQSSGGPHSISPGVAKFLMEFLKSNPDLAKEMSTRMQAVINGKQIQGQQQPPPGGSGPPGQGMGQKPPMPPGGPQMPPQMPMKPGG